MLVRRPRAALAVVGAVIAVVLGASLAVPDRLKVAGFTDSGSESARALETQREILGFDPEPGLVISARAGYDFRSARGREAVAELAGTLARDPAVGRVETAFGREGLPFLVADEGRKTLVLVHFRDSGADALAEPIRRLRPQIRLPGAHVDVGGYAVGFLDIYHATRADLLRAQAIAIPVLALLLLVIFRGLAPAAVPLALGGISVIGTLAGLRLLGNVMDISVFARNLGALLGLGLGTDYGLLLVYRYREEAARHGPGAVAVRATLATAGRTVAFSGWAIAAAFASLLVFPQRFLFSMGVGGIVVAAVSAAATLAVAPALLTLLGGRIGARAEGGGAAWYRWTGWVMRRPGEVALATAAVLVAAAAPALLLKPTSADYRAVPHGYEARTVGETIGRDYSPQLQYPVNVAVRLDGITPDLALAGILQAPGVVGSRVLPGTPGGYAFAQLLLAEPLVSDGSRRVIEDLRSRPLPILVGGRTAEFADLEDSIVHRAPLAAGLAALATFVVVFLLTGSLVLPAKALLFNALGLAAVFGLLVLVFQQGAPIVAPLVGYEGPEGVELTASVVVIAATFGLATDYSILLLSRIVEEHESGRPDAEAVARGIQRTGPVITLAALLLSVPLLALASSRIFLIKQLGVGLAFGVLLDATLIRMLLVPASMGLLGRANWWAPAPLLRARARLRRSPLIPVRRRG